VMSLTSAASWVRGGRSAPRTPSRPGPARGPRVPAPAHDHVLVTMHGATDRHGPASARPNGSRTAGRGPRQSRQSSLITASAGPVEPEQSQCPARHVPGVAPVSVSSGCGVRRW